MWYVRLAAVVFAAALLLYAWTFWTVDPDWLLLFLFSFGCVGIVLATFVPWKSLAFAALVSIFHVWSHLKRQAEMEEQAKQQLLPYVKQRCLVCVALLQKDAHYCMRCGTPTGKRYSIRWCPACHHRMPLDANYCPQCRYGMSLFAPPLLSKEAHPCSPPIEDLPTQKTTRPLSDAWGQIEALASKVTGA
jgi:hypothetical protein